MEHIGPYLFSGLRFALGALVLLPFIMRRAASDASRRTPGILRGGLLLGVVLTLGVNLQQVGLMFTSVTNAGFITGLYVIVVPLLGLLLGHKAGVGIWLGACLAVLGMFLLSVGDNFQVASGDWLQLIGAFVWGGHVLLVGHYARRHDVLVLSVLQLSVCAVVSLGLALAFESWTWEAIMATAPSLIYGGVISVGVAYTVQMVAQKHAIASHAAIIFSLEAVFAAIAGALWLNEALALKGYIGCLLMFAGMLLAQLWPKQQEIVADPFAPATVASDSVSKNP
jgi:drug/metabolite transporter (DMT)-like permease